MTVNNTENTKDKDHIAPAHTQPSGLQLALVFAGFFVILPLLPVFIANLAYSFSGHAPKIYWYLSRAGGFIALSILWVSMAMGLGLTNKLARVWPGAPTAFAIHEYVSLLGLLFAAYHGLVLIGDHYVDFSLPRLLVPFSIRYEPFWVGLGQVAFYTWVIVLLSFYIRQYIGQKTWRMIHYVNFATYMMGLFHGLFSGTDGTASWAHWYYGISAGTLIALVVYRVYNTMNKKPASRPKPTTRVEPAAATAGAIPVAAANALQAPLLEQASPPMGFPPPMEHPAPAISPTGTESIPQPLMIERVELQVSEYAIAESSLPIGEETPVVTKIFRKISIPPAEPAKRTRKNLQRDQMQTPAYLEPATLPSQRTLRIKRAAQSRETRPVERKKVFIPNVRLDGRTESKQINSPPLIQRIRENLGQKK